MRALSEKAPLRGHESATKGNGIGKGMEIAVVRQTGSNHLAEMRSNGH